MTSPVPDVAASLQWHDPKEYVRWDISVYVSESSSPAAKKMLGAITLYDFVFAFPPVITPNDWPKLLLETNYKGGQWLKEGNFVTPELSHRWSSFSFFTLIAASAGFPSDWTLRVDGDTTAKTFTQEQAATIATGSPMPWATDDQDSISFVDSAATAQRTKLIELVAALRQANQHELYLQLAGGDVGALEAVSHGIQKDDIAGLIPAHFAASTHLAGVARQKSGSPEGTCCLSQLEASLEGAHLFDASLSPKVIIAMLQALEARAPSAESSSSRLYNRLKQNCHYNLVDSAHDEKDLQSPEKNIIPLHVTLHQALDIRARAQGKPQACLFIEPFEGRAGLWTRTALPAAYIAAAAWRDISPSALPNLDLPTATGLTIACSGEEPWKTPSTIFLTALQSRKISPGLLAKSCENIYQLFSAKAFKAKVDETAAKVAEYFSDSKKRKASRSPGGKGDDDDDNDDGDDTAGASGAPGPSSSSGRGGKGGKDGGGGGGGAGGSSSGGGGGGSGSTSRGGRSVASGSRGPSGRSSTAPRFGTSTRSTQRGHQPTWHDLEALDTLLVAYADVRQLQALSVAFEGLQNLARAREEPAWDVFTAETRQAWSQESVLLKEGWWSWELYEEMKQVQEVQNYRAAWLCLLGGCPTGS
ncbi:unnamed protein product [Sympodiomycopsis kandeliae]